MREFNNKKEGVKILYDFLRLMAVCILSNNDYNPLMNMLEDSSSKEKWRLLFEKYIAIKQLTVTPDSFLLV